MITVTLTHDQKSGFTLTLSGHAKAAEAGRDIICASASILAYTVAQEVKNMEIRHQLAEPPLIKMESGDALIKFLPKNDAAYNDALHTLYVAEVGFALLARNYPQYVELIIGEQA